MTTAGTRRLYDYLCSTVDPWTCCPALDWLRDHRHLTLTEALAACPEPSWLRDLASRLDIDPRLSVARLAWRVGTTTLRRLDTAGAVEQARELREVLESGDLDLWEAGAPQVIEAAAASALVAAGLPMNREHYAGLVRDIVGPLVLAALRARGVA